MLSRASAAAVLLIGAFFIGNALTNSNASAATTVTVTASNWNFAPGEITVKVNEPTTLAFTSKQGVHGVSSSELGIPQTLLTPGNTVTVTFTPTKVGTYSLHCSVPCGPGHTDMVLHVHVVS